MGQSRTQSIPAPNLRMGPSSNKRCNSAALNRSTVCVGVMYSGEYDACDVTLSVYPHRASLKNMPDHDGNRTYDLWNTSPMLCQLSYAVWSVRVCDISEQNLVPSVSMLSNNNHDFFCVGVMYSGEYDACDVTLSVYPHRASLKNMPDTVGIEPTTFGILAQCSAN